MKAKIEINLDNDAFQLCKTSSLPSRELGRLLRGLAEDIENNNACNLGSYFVMIDINGNKVGDFNIVQDDDSGYTCMVPDGDDNHYRE